MTQYNILLINDKDDLQELLNENGPLESNQFGFLEGKVIQDIISNTDFSDGDSITIQALIKEIIV